MTKLTELKALAEKATKGPWHHVQAFETVPAVRTIHGKVPAQRVDYVSTWPGPGTPKGHRVVIPMETATDEGVIRTVTSDDMAFIVAAINALPALIQVAEAAEGILPVIGDRALYGAEHKRLLDALAQLREPG